MFFFIYNLTSQLVTHFGVSAETFSWPLSCSCACACVTCSLRDQKNSRYILSFSLFLRARARTDDRSLHTDLLSSLNCIFLPSFRTFLSERQLLLLYFLISLVGTLLLIVAMFTRLFSLFAAGSLLYLGIAEGGISSLENSIYSSRCTHTPCVPKVFATTTFASGILQTVSHYYLVPSFWT